MTEGVAQNLPLKLESEGNIFIKKALLITPMARKTRKQNWQLRAFCKGLNKKMAGGGGKTDKLKIIKLIGKIRHLNNNSVIEGT